MPLFIADSKLNISHSTIEKQRRDRINSLIDEVLGHGDLGWDAVHCVQHPLRIIHFCGVSNGFRALPCLVWLACHNQQ
jgi:hypothetical protein